MKTADNHDSIQRTDNTYKTYTVPKVPENLKGNVYSLPFTHPTETTTDSQTMSQVDGLAYSLQELICLQSAPKVDIDDFDGNPLEYQYFISVFEVVVEINDT